MDKKNTAIGIFFIIAAIVSMWLGSRLAPSHPAAPATPATAPGSTTLPESAQPVGVTPAQVPPTAFAAVSQDAAQAHVTTLENEFIAVNFTNFGGAIRDVAIKKYAAEKGNAQPFVFNALHADPMLAFVDLPGLDRSTAFELVSSSATEVVYRAVFDNRIEVTRRYTIFRSGEAGQDPYRLRHETTFRNLADQPLAMPRVALSLGTAAPTDAHDLGLKLTAGYSNGDDQHFNARSELEASSGFLGIGGHDARPLLTGGGPVVWATVGNQFFSTILTPDTPAAGTITRRVKLFSSLPDTDQNAYGISAAAQFDVSALPAGGETKIGANFYVGPKEYSRLSNGDIFKADEDRVMQFGFFKWFAQLLITIMSAVHGWFPNATWAWGWAIVLTTLFLKIVFVPFTLAASKSAKRMAKIQPEMQAIREKFKDNPQKLQQATMELFKKHKVNPVGGCLPVLITIPFFIGFFSMLQSTAELRFQPFLWASDLSAPDTIAHVFGLPINILPLLMGATMVIQMRLTPSPSMDNAQMKIMKFMPYIFTLFCYNFSCALALYSTVNGLFTIGQQLVINRMKDEPGPQGPGTAAATTAGTFAKPMKNVTPKKKK